MNNQIATIKDFNEFEKSLADFKGQYNDVVYDLTVPAEEKRARADRLAIGKVIAKLDAKHKEIKAPIKEKVDLIDGERKRIKDDLLGVQEKIKSQIAEHERKIAEKAAADQKLVRYIYESADFEFAPSSDQILIVIERIKAIDIDDDAYYDVKAQAALAISETLKSLDAILEEQKEKEAQQAEIDRLRKEKEDRYRAEREEMIARKAADDAKLEAEQKAAKLAEDNARREQEAKDAQAKAKAKADADIAKLKQDKVDAENAAKKAKHDAEEKRKRDIAETEARIKREALEQKAQEEAEAKSREKDKANKTRVNNEALTAIVGLGISDAQAKSLIKAIYKGQVPNIKITY